jgi:DNA-binding response OmpR family regulator
MALEPGRLSRAAIHCGAGEAELRMSAAGNWQLAIRAAEEREWRLACSGDLDGGAVSQFAASANEPLRIGRLLVDPERRQVFACEREVRASRLEFDLLATLASDPTRVFSKQELMRTVWRCEAVHSCRTLDSHASRLRVKLRRAGAPGFVLNCQAMGYKLWGGVPGAEMPSSDHDDDPA